MSKFFKDATMIAVFRRDLEREFARSQPSRILDQFGRPIMSEHTRIGDTITVRKPTRTASKAPPPPLELA